MNAIVLASCIVFVVLIGIVILSEAKDLCNLRP